MCQLLETICIENRQIRNADLHNRRMNQAREELFRISSGFDIRDIIKIPIGMGMGMYKCRILYDKKIMEVQVLPHQPRIIKSLKIVEDNEIDYRYKYTDRSRLEELLRMKGDCDDILILKNGYVTDTSFSNIVFHSPDKKWVTPSTPLLNGTMRQYLIEKGEISEMEIPPADLPRFSQARLINCMTNLETGSVIRMVDIKC